MIYKILILFLIFICISCRTKQTEIDNIEINMENNINIKGSIPLEIITSRHINNSEKIPLVESATIIEPQYKINPEEQKKELSPDSFLRMIELHKKYYTFKDLKETGFLINEVTSIFSNADFFYTGTLKGAVIGFNKNDNILLRRLKTSLYYSKFKICPECGVIYYTLHPLSECKVSKIDSKKREKYKKECMEWKNNILKE